MTDNTAIRPKKSNYLTLVQLNTLRSVTAPLDEVWNETIYQTGSSLERADFRDVDLRVCVTERQIARRFGDLDGNLLMMNHIISDWLSLRTGLDIDFQFQPAAEFHEYDGRPRNPLGAPGQIWPAIEYNTRYLAEHPKEA